MTDPSIPAPSTRRSHVKLLAELLIYANVSWLLVYDYLARLNAFNGLDQEAWFAGVPMVQGIADGEGVDPYRYRILVPVTVMSLDRVDNAVVDLISTAQIQRVYYLVCLIALMLLVRLVLVAYGFSRSVGFSGALLVAALLPIALRDHGYQAWSWLEVVLFALAVLMALRYPSIIGYSAITLIAMLNRETAIVLPLIPLALSLSRRRSPEGRVYLRMSAFSAIVAVTVFGFLRLVWPGPTSTRDIALEALWEANLKPDLLNLTRENLVILMSSLVITAVVAVIQRRTPRDARWIAGLVIPPLIIGWLLFALWWEVRVLLPVVILLLPLSLSVLFSHRGHDSSRSSTQHSPD